MGRGLRSWWLGCVLLCCTWLTHAQVKVVVVSSEATPAYMDAAQAVLVGLANGGVSRYEVQLLTAAEWAAQGSGSSSGPVLWVALGTQATTSLANKGVTGPVLSALIPRASFDRVTRITGRHASSRWTAVYLDQPLGRQLALIHLALPLAKRVGLLLGPDAALKTTSLRTMAQANGLSLTEVTTTGQGNLFADLQRVLENSDVLWALPDPLVFNSSSIQNTLLTTFRAKVPVVAFSPAYVRAGALLGLFTTPEQTGRQVAAMVLDALQGRSWPDQPAEPNDFEVAVNEQVATALGLTLDAKTLRLALRRQERLP